MSRGAADVLAAHSDPGARPVSVTFQVTDRCNYECVHCYQEHSNHDELSFDEIKRVLEELAEAGVLFITLMGGEFFMRRDADQILLAAHELGFAIRLKTTGHHVHDKRADLIAACRPIHVDLSLYAASKHIHEQVTRQPGSWKRTYDAAQRLIARGVPVQLNAPVMDGNVGDLENLVALAEKIGAKHSFDAKVTGMENGDQHPVALRMSRDTLEAFYRHEANGIPAYIAETYADAIGSERRALENPPCRAGHLIGINPRGKVWPCNALPIDCGDLREQSFKEIWFGSEGLAEIRGLTYATLNECNVCPVRDFCSRCHAMAWLEQGDIRGPSLEACRHAVFVRDALREKGIVPETHTDLPPTWDRVDLDGQHHDQDESRPGTRSVALRVLS